MNERRCIVEKNLGPHSERSSLDGWRVVRTRQGRRTASLAACLLAVLPAFIQAAPVSLDCRYPQSSDPEGGLRSAEVPLEFRFTIDRAAGTARMRSGEFVADLELRFSRRHLTLFQTTANESLYVTTIVFEAFDESDLYRSVHSRHAIIGGLGELRASQYYGRCEPVLDENGEPAA